MNCNFNESGVKSTKDLSMNNSSIFDQSDFKVCDIIKKGKSYDEYLTYYCRLIDYALQRGLKKSELEGYYEKHHILPRCMGGENNKSNYVILTFKEHIIAHALLYRMYSKDANIYTAIRLMVKSNYRFSERVDNIESILSDENLISLYEELKRDSVNFIKLSIVCCDENDNLLKIYDGIIDTTDDGFAPNTISAQLSQNKDRSKNYLCKGYYWNTLEGYKENFPKKYNEFLNNPIKAEITPKDKDLRVVCFNRNDNSIIKIYNKAKDAEIDGFKSDSISNVVIGRNKSYAGYGWCKIKDYPLKDKIEEYYSNSDKSRSIEILYPNRVVCCNENLHIIKIYNKQGDVIEDGFSDDGVSSCVCGRTKGSKHRGYYWYKYEEFRKLNPKEVENYYNRIENGYIPEVKAVISDLRVVCHDEDNNVFKIYKNGVEPEEDGFKSNTLSPVLTKKRKHSSGYCWTKFEEFYNNYPDKVEEYYRKLENGYVPNVKPIKHKNTL